MTRKTLKLPEEDYERHNARRKEMGLSWVEYIDGQAPDITDSLREVIREEVPGAGGCRICEAEATHALVVSHDGDFNHTERYCETHADLAAEDAQREDEFQLLRGPTPIEEVNADA